MNIIWLGHGSFRIEIAGEVLLVDPWFTGNPVFPEDRKADAIAGATHILLTHCHFDHVADVLELASELKIPVVGQYDLMGYWAEAEGIETVGFNKGGTVMLGDVAVTMVNAVHSSSFGTPEGPKWVIFDPMASRMGRLCSKASSGPPTMKLKLPASAPAGPPETGASSIDKPWARAASARSLVLSTSMVEQSIRSVPGFAFGRTSVSCTSVT